MTSIPTNAEITNHSTSCRCSACDAYWARHVRQMPTVDWNDTGANRIEQLYFGIAIGLLVLAVIIW